MIPPSFEPLLYAVMRVVFGLMFVTYGIRKLGLLDEPAEPLLSLMGAAGVIETVGGTLIAVGLLTRPVAFIAAGEMAVAYFMSHAPRAPLPVLNNGIPAVLFCFAFLYMVARGSGRYSLEATRTHSGNG
jgi:putative oxidoreductase